MLFDYKRLAKKISMSNNKPDYTGARTRRKLKSIEYIVIHNTGGTKDTAKNNADYFATGNKVKAGAWAFVDREGKSALSVPIKYIAYHCGGSMQSNDKGSGTYFGRCQNYNSVGIELCAIADKLPTKEQLRKTRQLVRYVKKKCPNAKVICRHWDVTGKDCPHLYKGIDNEKWEGLKEYLDN